ncbi:hypothetical protein BDF19DRAFT_461959, partial [Syncephalis fuscata]
MVYWLLGVNSAYSSAVIAVIAVISANDQSVWFLQVITRSSATVFCLFCLFYVVYASLASPALFLRIYLC